MSSCLSPCELQYAGLPRPSLSQSLLRLMPLSAVMPCKHLTLRHPSPPAFIFPSIRVFSSESALRIRWPEYWSFSFSINPSSEYSEFISLRIDWFDLLCPRNSQESSLTPEFKSINSSALSFLYSPTLKAKLRERISAPLICQSKSVHLAAQML